MDETPTNDAELKTALDELFKKWKGAVSFGDRFVEDGALPGYSRQKLKILFIGREAYGCEGLRDVWKTEEGCPCNYWKDYQKEKNLPYPCEGRKLMNLFLAGKDALKGQRRPRVAQRAAKITCGLLKLYGAEQKISWGKIPKYPEGISFAFMDASKYAHMCVEKSELNSKFSEYALESLELTREEIDILDPDLIISWNLAREPGVDFLKRLTDPSLKGPFPDDPTPTRSKPVSIWTYKGKREIPLLNTYHFSAPVSPKRDIYDPIREALKFLVDEGKLSKDWI